MLHRKSAIGGADRTLQYEEQELDILTVESDPAHEFFRVPVEVIGSCHEIQYWKLVWNSQLNFSDFCLCTEFSRLHSSYIIIGHGGCWCCHRGFFKELAHSFSYNIFCNRHHNSQPYFFPKLFNVERWMIAMGMVGVVLSIILFINYRLAKSKSLETPER